MAVGILGLRGSGSFTADERPQNWRQGILLMFPNGDAPLTALLSVLPSEPTDDPQVNWFEKTLPIQRGRIGGAAVGDVNPGEPSTIAAGSASPANDIVSISLTPDGGALDDYSWLTPGYILMNEVTEENYLVIKVAADHALVRRDIGQKFVAGGVHTVAITGNVATGDTVTAIGFANQEGAPVGAPVSFQPIRHFNFTQIIRTPLSLTRTARRTKLRYDKTGPYMEAKREALQIHSLLIERALMFSEREEITAAAGAATPFLGGSNPIGTGNPARTMRGMLNWLPAITTGTTPTLHWDLGTANTGQLTETFFDQWLEEVFRFGSSEKLCFAGSTALNVLNQLAKNKMTIQAVPSDRVYGMNFNRYTTPFGDLMVKQHPLMSHNPTWRKDLMVIDTAHIRARILDDTAFLRNRQAPGDDASVDEFLTELSLETRFSGAVPSTAGGLQGTAGPGVHARLKGIAALGG